jgi:hypothetical protein
MSLAQPSSSQRGTEAMENHYLTLKGNAGKLLPASDRMTTPPPAPSYIREELLSPTDSFDGDSAGTAPSPGLLGEDLDFGVRSRSGSNVSVCSAHTAWAAVDDENAIRSRRGSSDPPVAPASSPHGSPLLGRRRSTDAPLSPLGPPNRRRSSSQQGGQSFAFTEPGDSTTGSPVPSPPTRRRPSAANEGGSITPALPARPSLHTGKRVALPANHGMISRQEAERRLLGEDKPVGLYLLREKEPGRVYALSVVQQGGDIKHHLIERAVRKDGHLGNHWILNNKRLRDCSTLECVVEMVRQLPGPDGLPVLRNICPLPCME